MNIGTFIVLIIVALIMGFAIRKVIKDKRSGKTCSSCSSCSACNGSCSANKMVDNILKK